MTSPFEGITLDSVKKRMVPIANLKWGQSPWDSLSREELLYLVYGYHVVVSHLLSIIRMFLPASDIPSKWREHMWGAVAARDHVFSDFDPEQHRRFAKASAERQTFGVDWCAVQYGSQEAGKWSEEHEGMWRCTMRPVTDQTAFDVYSETKWQHCPVCQITVGSRSDPDDFCLDHGKATDRCRKRPATFADGRIEAVPEGK